MENNYNEYDDLSAEEKENLKYQYYIVIGILRLFTIPACLFGSFIFILFFKAILQQTSGIIFRVIACIPLFGATFLILYALGTMLTSLSSIYHGIRKKDYDSNKQIILSKITDSIKNHTNIALTLVFTVLLGLLFIYSIITFITATGEYKQNVLIYVILFGVLSVFLIKRLFCK